MGCVVFGICWFVTILIGTKMGTAGQIPGLIIFSGGCIYLVRWIIQVRRKASEEQEEKSKTIDQTRGESTRFLAENAFTVSKSIEIYADNSKLFFDDTNHKWYYKNYLNPNSANMIYTYKELLSFHIFEDGVTSQSGNTGAALVGGALLGGIGAIAGAAASKTLAGKCNQLQIQIIVDDISNHEINIALISSEEGLPKNGDEYKKQIALARNITSALEYVKNKAG
jgi:hypothetical protein